MYSICFIILSFMILIVASKQFKEIDKGISENQEVFVNFIKRF